MKKFDSKPSKKLSLNGETVRNLSAGDTAPQKMPTIGNGCSVPTWAHCYTHGHCG